MCSSRQRGTQFFGVMEQNPLSQRFGPKSLLWGGRAFWKPKITNDNVRPLTLNASANKTPENR
jgi:hypothetical protein